MAGLVMYYFGFPRVMEILGLIMVGVGIADIIFIVIERPEERRYEEQQRRIAEALQRGILSATDAREEEVLLVQGERDSSGGTQEK